MLLKWINILTIIDRYQETNWCILIIVMPLPFVAGKTDKTDTQCLEKNGVRCLRVNPDGQLLASGDRQGNIRYVAICREYLLRYIYFCNFLSKILVWVLTITRRLY